MRKVDIEEDPSNINRNMQNVDKNSLKVLIKLKTSGKFSKVCTFLESIQLSPRLLAKVSDDSTNSETGNDNGRGFKTYRIKITFHFCIVLNNRSKQIIDPQV